MCTTKKLSPEYYENRFEHSTPSRVFFFIFIYYTYVLYMYFSYLFFFFINRLNKLIFVLFFFFILNVHIYKLNKYVSKHLTGGVIIGRVFIILLFPNC